MKCIANTILKDHIENDLAIIYLRKFEIYRWIEQGQCTQKD